nr:immunoglobulin heavy chain junction region [Macaca mulatta]
CARPYHNFWSGYLNRFDVW